MHLEQSGDLGCRPTGREHAEDFRALCLSELRPSAAMPPLRAGRFQAGLGALLHHLPLVLRERAEHLHHHPPSRHGRVDGFGKRAEACAGGGDPFQDQQKILEGPRQTVEMGYSGIRRAGAGRTEMDR